MAVGQASVIIEEAFPKDKLSIPAIRTNYFYIEPLKLNYLIATLTIETIRENKIIKSLNKQRYRVFHYDDGVAYETETSEQGLEFKLDFKKNGILKVSFKFDYSINNRLLLLNSIEFIESLNLASQLRIGLEEEGSVDTLNLPNLNFNLSEMKELVENVIIIETYAGQKLVIPPDFLEYINFLKIKVIAGIIDTKLCLYRPLEIEVPKDIAIELVDAYINNRKILPMVLNFKDTLLGKEIIVENVLLDPKTIIPADNLSKLYKSILISDNELIKIKFISITERSNDIQTHISSLNEKTSTIDYRKLINNSKHIFDEMNIPSYSHKILYIILLKLNDYLLSKNIKSSFTIEKMDDPEEDWDYLKLNIYVNQSLEYIFKNLYIPIYEIVDKNITKELAKKIFIKIEPTFDLDKS